MKIKFENISKEELKQRKKMLEELLEEEFEDMELNDENLAKARRIAKKYEEATSSNWDMEQPKIILADSAGTELASLK